MTDVTNISAVRSPPPPDEAAAEDDAPISHPRELPRRKIGLFEQEHFLRSMADRCVMHSGAMKGTFAGEATLALTREDMAALMCIADTLNLFNLYGAADYVRGKAQREAERKRGGAKK